MILNLFSGKKTITKTYFYKRYTLHVILNLFSGKKTITKTYFYKRYIACDNITVLPAKKSPNRDASTSKIWFPVTLY